MGSSSSIWSRLRDLLGAPKPTRQSPPKEPSPPPPPPTVSPPSGQTPRNITTAASVVDLVLGIDFGTSCTKAMIGDPGWKDCSFAIPFGNANSGIATWLRPTRFGTEANLKMRLMNDPRSEKVRDLVACYVAEVIAISRSWFASHSPADYRRRDLRWSLNLGFPGKALDASPLAAAYRGIAMTAVALSSDTELPSLERAASIRLNTTKVEPFIAPSRVQLYPEIAAQLAGYVNSPFRDPGNLVLIDVGAGTLDVSTIILHTRGDRDVVSFHVCEVAPLGALRLYQNRCTALESLQPGCVQHDLEFFQDGDRPVPEPFEDMVSQPWKHSPQLRTAFKQASNEFGQDVVDTSWSCLARFRKLQKQAHSSPSFEPWGDKLRFFVTGGGSRSRFYRQLLAEGPLEQKIMPYTRWHPDPATRRASRQGLHPERIPTPPPEKLKGFPAALSGDFDRLSVAYGLAFGGEDLMKITSATKQ